MQRTVAIAQDLGGRDQLARIEPVGDRDDVGEQRRVVAARQLLDDADEPHVGQRGRSPCKPHRRLEWERGDEHDGPHFARCSMRCMKAVFLAPSYPPEMQQYTRGLAEVGADVYGVGDQPVAALPASVKAHLADYLQVPRLLDDDDV